MAEETQLTKREATEGEEEIIEKKPSAPTATVLMILTTVFLALAIYITGDEVGFYFNKSDYEANKRAEDHYNDFSRTEKLTVEEGESPEPGGLERE